jgi:hypothetical protein
MARLVSARAATKSAALAELKKRLVQRNLDRASIRRSRLLDAAFATDRQR